VVVLHFIDFPETLLPSTFALASQGNGIVAIIAGIMAQIAADRYGEIGPFRLAIAVTVLAAVLITSWPENYSNTSRSTEKDGAVDTKKGTWLSVWSQFTQGSIWKIGLAYSIFEGAIFIFGTLHYSNKHCIEEDPSSIN
jgi:hypothetical protein